MGKAVILGGGAGGLYTIEQSFALPGQEAELVALRAKVAALDGQVKLVQDALKLKDLEVEEAVLTLNAMIDDWQAKLLAGLDPDPPIDPTPADPGAVDPDEVSNARADCLAAHNAIRGAAGLGALSNNTVLAMAAQAHADWMANGNPAGHTGAGGSRPHERMTAAGYPSGPGTVTGENVAVGQSSVEQAMQGWMNSPGHKANILETRYTEAGIGYAYRPLGAYRHYWVVNFGRLPD